MSKYFTIPELISSNTARILGIKNKPDEEQTKHLFELMSVLDTLREKWGKPIRVNSGFRCKELNNAVGGSKSSAHMLGYAADLYPMRGTYDDFLICVKEWAENNDYDQLLIENDSAGNNWIHLGLYNNFHKQRHQIKLMEQIKPTETLKN